VGFKRLMQSGIKLYDRLHIQCLSVLSDSKKPRKQTFVKVANTKFDQNPSSEWRMFPVGWSSASQLQRERER